jgi:hypothetical protein
VQQDRWSNGGARGNSAPFSKDGGRTWKTVVPPGVSLCSGGRYQRASDPWVDFSPNGTAYFMSLVTDNDPPSGSFGKNGMVVNRSTDGGATWSRAIQLSALPVGQSLDDKNSLTADPTNPNFAYAVWDRLTDFSLPPELRGGGAAGARARARFLRDRVGKADAGAKEDDPVFFKGPVYLARTTNGGRTWERAREIYDPGANQQTINNLIVVQPNGTLLDFFSHVYPTARSTSRSSARPTRDGRGSGGPRSSPTSSASARTPPTRGRRYATRRSCSTSRSIRTTARSTSLGRTRASGPDLPTRSPTRRRPTAAGAGPGRPGST